MKPLYYRMQRTFVRCCLFAALFVAALSSKAALRVAAKNHISNIEFWQSNFGELFINTSVASGTWGTFWPRGSGFQYIFGGGFWFGDVNNNSRHVLVGYNPYNGGSWFQPGSVDAAQSFYDSTALKGIGRYPNEADTEYAKKYPIYFSTSYNKNTGRSLSPGLPPWPMWDTDPDTNKIVGYDHYFGNYVDSIPLRDTSVYPLRYVTKYIRHVDTMNVRGHDSIVVSVDTVVVRKGGPAFVSDEDMFTVSNPLDTSYFVQDANTNYPALEVQRSIYSWGSGAAQNDIWLVYTLINKSNFTIDSCWFAPVVDADIGNPTNDENGYYAKDSTMNFAMQWSREEVSVPGAANQASAYPGVLGMKFLQTPVLYKTGEVADSLVNTLKPGFYFPDKQIGLVTYDRWEISGRGDPTTDEGRYSYFVGRNKDTAINQVSDKRMLMATGPFKLLAGQSVQIAWGLVIARDTLTAADIDLGLSMNDCIAQARQMQIEYDNTFNPVGQRTGVEQRQNFTANTWSMNAYPNPFANTAHLSFTLSQASPATVILYDMMGREVMRLA
ncbi:MAG TPA: hypothetical protein VFJ29_03965, partial [Candidatus Kapabacteria bacterium]|nr:hypothetical protein [Candidatus Kapabacteria bacterium]